MRAAWLILATGCFDPKLAPHLRCATPDNWCPPPQMCGGDGYCNGGSQTMPDGGLPEGNVMFVSSETFTPGAGSNNALEPAASQKCQQLGNRLRTGTYVAWLGISSGDAASRIAPVPGWGRPDGKPFATSLGDVMNDHIYYPPRIDDSFADAPLVHLQTPVATGLPVPPNASCDTIGNVIMFGAPDGDMTSWRNTGDVYPCTDAFYLYCFETDRTTPVAAPQLDPSLLYAFVTSSSYDLSIGLGGLDLACQNEGSGLGSRVFQAFVATTLGSARDRFQPSTKSWSRLDGVVIASPSLERFEAPLSTTAAGASLAVRPAIGAPNANSVAKNTNCSDWTQDAAGMNVLLGDSTRSDSQAFAGTLGDTCNNPQYLYCLESPM
jgi:hypothetical protein